MNIKTYTPKLLFLPCAWVKLDLSSLPLPSPPPPPPPEKITMNVFRNRCSGKYGVRRARETKG